MIEVTYHRTYHRITVKGHAQCGEQGHDLVCAAVSGLVLTAAENVASFVAQGNARDPVVKLQEGDAEITMTPSRKMKSVATLMLDTICTGFQVYESLYPENIRFEVLG